MRDKVYVIGIGDNGEKSLGNEALDSIRNAEILFGGERHLEFFRSVPCEKVAVKSNLKEVAARINSELGKKRMVVLASGDPLFYGIGKYILAKVPKDKVEVVPQISAMQVAFARVKESWEDAVLVSLHAKPMDDLIQAARSGDPKKIGLFTDEVNTPSAIAQALLDNGLNGYRAHVCENLGGPEEKIVSAELDQIAAMRFAPLNVVVLVRKSPEHQPESSSVKEWSFGIPDLEFYQRTPEKGLITKSEVRVIALSKMNLNKSSVVWDIGAGSGSVSIESALIAKEGKVFAVEKNAEDFALIRQNIVKFRTEHVQAIHGLAPSALKDIPQDPDAVFVGGSSGNMPEILKLCGQRLKPGGRIVVNVITVENLAEAWNAFKAMAWKADVTLLQIARSQPILDMTRFSALNPIFVITARK